MSVGKGDGKYEMQYMKYLNYFDVPVIRHAAHVDPDKEQLTRQ